MCKSKLTTKHKGDSLATQIQLKGVVIGGLRRNKVIDNTELTEIEKIYTNSHITAIRHALTREKTTYNPVTDEELERLNFYISKAEQG